MKQGKELQTMQDDYKFNNLQQSLSKSYREADTNVRNIVY